MSALLLALFLQNADLFLRGGKVITVGSSERIAARPARARTPSEPRTATDPLFSIGVATGGGHGFDGLVPCKV